MSDRIFKAVVNGNTFEIPSKMKYLRKAQDLCGISVPEALAENKLDEVILAVICVAMCESGQRVTVEEVEEMCDFAECNANYIEFMRALTPEIKSSKNATKRTSKTSAGNSSNDTLTASSN